MRVVVTGGSGKGGRWVVRDLREHGHDVLNVDLRPDGMPHGQTVVADLTDLGQAHDLIAGADAVVHFAAIPAPELRAEGETFRINALRPTTCSRPRSRRRSVGSSGRRRRPSSACRSIGRRTSRRSTNRSRRVRSRRYSLSKLVGETMAEQFARRSGIGFVGLRISNIMEPGDYAAFPSYWDDPMLRKWNLWGYVDARDVAAAARLALEAPIEGAEICIVAAADTVMRRRQRRPDGRGLPRRAAPPPAGGPRDPALHRPRAAGARLRARPPLGRPHRDVKTGDWPIFGRDAPDVAWRPDPDAAFAARLADFLRLTGEPSLDSLQARAVADPGWFWGAAADDLGDRLGAPAARRSSTASGGPAWARWWLGGSFD